MYVPLARLGIILGKWGRMEGHVEFRILLKATDGTVCSSAPGIPCYLTDHSAWVQAGVGEWPWGSVREPTGISDTRYKREQPA